jgi:hypothetical protein
MNRCSSADDGGAQHIVVLELGEYLDHRVLAPLVVLPDEVGPHARVRFEHPQEVSSAADGICARPR